jgi:hypothetical protein
MSEMKYETGIGPWETGRPPNGQLVYVEDIHGIIRVRAIYGDERYGVRPHWESEDRDTLWHPSAFSRWRALAPAKEDQ